MKSTYHYNIKSIQQQLLLPLRKISHVMGMIDKRLKDQSQFCLLRDVFVEQSIFLMGNLLYHFLRCILVCVIPCITKSILSPLYILFELFFHFTQLKKASVSSLRKVIRSLMESPNRSSRIYNNIKLLVYYVFIITFPELEARNSNFSEKDFKQPKKFIFQFLLFT